MSKVNCEAVGKRRQAPPGMARAELVTTKGKPEDFFIAKKEYRCYT